MSASRLNCWEYYNCEHIDCLVRKRNEGNICWAVPEAMRDGKVLCSFIEKLQHCSMCDFHNYVKSLRSEEKEN